MDGIFNINKPLGCTSHDVVSRVRRAVGMKRVGHTGTLDPEASGVLPICVGKATRAADFLTAEEKRYTATLRLGASTDTQDATGVILEQKDVVATEREIIEVINSFVGEIEQLPPMYSAVRVDGKRLYELARQGKEIERNKRKITIFSIDILDINGTDITLDVKCSKGTYIRTLCNDIGEKLGCGGHMAKLERTASGIFCLGNAVTLDRLEDASRIGDVQKFLIPLEDVFSDYLKFVVSGAVEKRVKNGCHARVKNIEIGQKYRVYSDSGEFLCVSQGDVEEGFTVLRLIKSFY